MNLFVDTSVWSLALRRDSPPEVSEVRRLREALAGGTVYTTGLVLQELLQGFHGPRARTQLIRAKPMETSASRRRDGCGESVSSNWRHPGGQEICLPEVDEDWIP